MSAIAGFYGSAHPDQARAWLEAMIRRLRHRGPDTLGFYIDGSVGLCHAHPFPKGPSAFAPPMVSRRGDAAIAYDLDICNHRQLVDRLESGGRRLARPTDAEILLGLYEQEGDAFVERLEGEFAIALWDLRRKRLLLARDRVGARPLHYLEAEGQVFFASEIKALFAAAPEKAALSPEGIARAFTYWAPEEPMTAFQGVQSLPAGHLLSFEGGERPSPKRYWDFHFPKRDDLRTSTVSLEEAASRLQSLLFESVRARMDGENPIGAYLSGGLDSSGVVAIMSRLSTKKIRTFSIAFDDADFDESAHQDEVARLFGTEHSTLRCSREQIAEIFPKLIRHVEAPLLRTAPAPLLLLSSYVRKSGFDRVMTGEGADEIFAGYDLFKEATVRAFCAKSPESTCRPRLFERLYPYLKHSPTQSPALAQAFFGQGLEHRGRATFAHQPRWSTSHHALTFFAEPYRQKLAGWDPLASYEETLPPEIDEWQPLARYQYVEAKSLLTNHLLSSQGDRVSMAHSVGARMPYLDRRVIEYASSLPSSFKLRGLRDKLVLRRALEGVLPRSIARRPKVPYRAPDSASFFVSGAAVDFVDELLSERRLRDTGLFDPIVVGRLREKCRAGRALGFRDNQAFVGIVSTMLLDELFVRHRS